MEDVLPLQVEASRGGDREAFNRLVLHWEKPIYNLALRMLHDPAEAEEATQEVFLTAFRHIRRFQARARFSTWLYRVAANHCLSRLRRRRHRVALAEPPPAAPAAQESELMETERRAQVGRALARLDPGQRMVVELKFFQEQTFEEISRILRVPNSTVKSRFYKGLEVLKRELR